MKREVSPRLVAGVLVVGVLVLVLIVFRVWSAPSVTPAPELSRASDSGGAGPKREPSLPGGGGPPPDALRFRDEYNRAHPDAAGSR